MINVAGPLARTVLAKVCDNDLGNAAFPFMTAQDIRISHAPATAYRITYIGELGWELYIPMEYMAYAYDTLMKAGAEHGIRNAGYRAIDSLRLEKRYLAWGADITPDYTPLEAGLGFVIDWEKGDFLGRDALDAMRKAGVTRRLACLALDAPLPVYGGEVVRVNGKAIAQTTSGGYGYSVEKSLVLAYLPTDLPNDALIEVDSFGQRSPATCVTGSAYDPKRLKILA